MYCHKGQTCRLICRYLAVCCVLGCCTAADLPKKDQKENLKYQLRFYTYTKRNPPIFHRGVHVDSFIHSSFLSQAGRLTAHGAHIQGNRTSRTRPNQLHQPPRNAHVFTRHCRQPPRNITHITATANDTSCSHALQQRLSHPLVATALHPVSPLYNPHSFLRSYQCPNAPNLGLSY